MKIIVYLLILITHGVVHAAPTEGFEATTLYGRELVPKTYFMANIGYENPPWRSDSEFIEAIGSFSTDAGNMFTFGTNLTVANTRGDRSHYMFKYDQFLWRSGSISFKWAHQDLKYISSSRDFAGLDFNVFFPTGEWGGFYLSLGTYYRWLKQRWNAPWWSPLNLETQDQEAFVHGTIGFQFPLFESSFWTLDLNAKDAFIYYGVDHLAFDATINFNLEENLYLRTLFSVRTSASWMGTMMPAIYTFSVGIVTLEF